MGILCPIPVVALGFSSLNNNILTLVTPYPLDDEEFDVGLLRVSEGVRASAIL